ncbi:MAG: hypothetical protein ACRCX2_18340 [Paraclostridium sp.]
MKTLTKKQLLDEEYQVTKRMVEAIYILEDGTLWSGEPDGGLRGLDHHTIEAFSEADRYDNQVFWKEVFTKLRLVMVVPECFEIIYWPGEESIAQVKWMKVAKSQGWKVKEFM